MSDLADLRDMGKKLERAIVLADDRASGVVSLRVERDLALEELAEFRSAFGLGPGVDLVEEFTWRAARDGQVIRNLTAEIQKRASQIGVACIKHDLTHSLACGHCLADAERKVAEIDRIIRPSEAPMGSNAYSRIQEICEAKS